MDSEKTGTAPMDPLKPAPVGPQPGDMQVSDIVPGSPVIITDAYGNEIKTRALSGVEVDGRGGHPVVRVERPLKGGSTESAPWPLEAVRPAPGNEPDPNAVAVYINGR